MWYSAQWGALCTKSLEVHLSAFICGLFHEDFSPIVGTVYVATIEDKSS